MQAKFLSALSSKRFFYATVALLVLQALWIALSARYPMAFDEDFHFGVIQLYSHHLSPFFSSQPAHADQYGAIFRDPSYLYHYLMSFVLRFIRLFIHGQTGQVIVLRLLNIAFFASALPLYRRLLVRMGASRAVTHAILLLFVLIPVAPLLAAQINYDNLLLPLVAASLLLAARLTRQLRQQHTLDIRSALLLVIICLLSSLVKYTFLPIFVAIILVVGWYVYRWRYWRGDKWHESWRGWRRLGRWQSWLIIFLLVISLGLFAQRYGVDMALYHSPDPSCGQVLDYNHCQHYGPWLRDYRLRQSHPQNGGNPFVFMADWLQGMWMRLFFAVSGPDIGYVTRGPLILPGLGAVAFASLGALLAVGYSKRIWRRYDHGALLLAAVAILIYCGSLWLQNYDGFRHKGVPVAINGRYLLPLLPFLMLLVAAGWLQLLRHRPRLKAAVAVVCIISFLWGGGALTFIIRSQNNWYWQNGAVKAANHALKHLAPAVPGSAYPTEFL